MQGLVLLVFCLLFQQWNVATAALSPLVCDTTNDGFSAHVPVQKRPDERTLTRRANPNIQSYHGVWEMDINIGQEHLSAVVDTGSPLL